MTISALIRWQMLSWPWISDKPSLVKTIDGIRHGATLAKRQLVIRLIVVLSVWSALIIGISNVGLGELFPMSDELRWQSFFFLSDELGHATHRLESPINDEDSVAAHAQSLRALATIKANSPVRSMNDKASALLSSYESKTKTLVSEPRESSPYEGFYMAKALADSADVQGYLLLGRAYEEGVGPDGVDFRLAYDNYRSAAKFGSQDGKKANDDLVKGLIESNRFTDTVVGQELVAHEAIDGNPKAQVWMAYIFRTGVGIHKDLEEARYWYSLASEQKEDVEARDRALLGLQLLDRLEREDKGAERFSPRMEKTGNQEEPSHSLQTSYAPIEAQIKPFPQHRTSISEELDRELEAELEKVKEFTPAAKEPVKPVPQQEAAIPQVKAPQTQLKTSGASGMNQFWGRVEAIIKSQWEPPPIDVTGTTYSTVIRFRFYRNGTVTDVGVQQSSGNPYFDDSGKRAILKPRQFPVFPADMTEAYKDVEMVFRLGESAG
jgi:TonB family protein